LSASDEVVMVRMGSLGRELAAARAERMALTTVPGWVRIWRGVKMQHGDAMRGHPRVAGQGTLVVIPCASTWLRLMT
jgi:hypothetical protein